MCIALIHLGHHLLCGAACLASRLLSYPSHLSWNRRTFFTHRTTRPLYATPVLIIYLENHTLHYTRLDCFAGWRLRSCCFLIFLCCFPPTSPITAEAAACVRVTIPRPFSKGWGVGLMGGWGIVSRVRELAFLMESSRFKSLRWRPQPAPALTNLNISTVSPVLLLYSTVLFLWFLLILYLSCSSP